MSTTILFPLQSHSFGEADPYAQAIQVMSAGHEHYFNHYNPTETPESTSYNIQPLKHQTPVQTPNYDWNSHPWPMVQPQSAQLGLVSQIQHSANPISPAGIDPGSLSAPVFTPGKQPMYYDSTASTSPAKSTFDTSNSASPVVQPMHLQHDSMYPREDETPPKRATPTPTTSSFSSSAPTTTRRRRTVEYVEPGSARAIYLEKNRRAASKCRSKQKYEQEQLVERSRFFERKNRILKSERDMLQAEVRTLKDLLGRHTYCPDQRIAQYLQMEANRLAAAKDYHQPF